MKNLSNGSTNIINRHFGMLQGDWFVRSQTDMEMGIRTSMATPCDLHGFIILCCNSGMVLWDGNRLYNVDAHINSTHITYILIKRNAMINIKNTPLYVDKHILVQSLQAELKKQLNNRYSFERLNIKYIGNIKSIVTYTEDHYGNVIEDNVIVSQDPRLLYLMEAIINLDSYWEV